MGLSRQKRKQLRESKRRSQLLPNGVMYIPSDFLYKYCLKCNHHAESKVADGISDDIFKSYCLLKCRAVFDVNKDLSGGLINVHQRGLPKVKEECSHLAEVLINADIDGLFESLT